MKKKLFLVFLMGLMALVMSSLLTKADAATLLDSTYIDEFANGIGENYTVIGDTDNKYTLVDKPGQLKVTDLDYGLYVRTKNELVIPEGKSLVVQWDIIENSVAAGWFVFMRGHNTHTVPWTNMVWHSFVAGNQLQGMNNGADVAGVSDDTGTQWTVLSRYATNSLMRQVYNRDGSAEIHASLGNLEEANLQKVYQFAAGQLDNSALNYFGFSGNGMSGSYLIDNFKMGYASDSSCSDITWLLEDNFDTAENWEIVEGKTQIGAAKYLSADNPANGAAIVYNNAFAKVEGVNKLFEASLDLDMVSMEAGKAIGLAAGLASDATSALNAPFVGVRKNAAGTAELVMMANGTDVQVVDLGAAVEGTIVTLNGSATVNAEGKIVVSANIGDKSVSAVVDSLDGHLAIATMGAEGSVVAKIKKLSINSYKQVVEAGRTLSTDFEAELNKNWQLVSKPSPETEGYVAVENGKLEFELAGDGAFFGTKYKYVNFDLKFDVKMQLFDEDDDGNIIKDSTWVGISFGKETIDASFAEGTSKLIYFQRTTMDLLGFAGNARTWVVGEQDLFDASNSTYTVRVHALDGTLTVYVTCLDSANPTETKIAQFHNVNTAGYVGVCCTAGGNFTVDNYSITNLDGNEAQNGVPTITTESTTVSVNAGETVNGSVTASDADGDALKFELVADNTAEYGALTFNADGTYSFVAKEDAATGSVTFTYKVTDTEDYSEVATVTIEVTAKPVEEPTPDQPTPDQPTPEQPTPEQPQPEQNSGCGGSILATLFGTIALCGVVVFCKRRKENE